MKKLIEHSTDHVARSIELLTEVKNVLHETIDSPYFKGNVTSVRDRYDEVDSTIDSLEEIQDYLENIDLTF